MKLDEYLNLLRWTSVVGARVLRVRDCTDIDKYTPYDVILVPGSMGDESGVSYTIISEDPEINDRLILWPNQFDVAGAWRLSNVVRASMLLKSFPAEYFESEV